MKPSIDQDFVLVLADFPDGMRFVETDPADATFQAAVLDIVTGQIEQPLAVVEFNPAEGLSRDVTEDVARSVAELVAREGDEPTGGLRQFLDANADGRSGGNVTALLDALRATRLRKKPPAPSVGSREGVNFRDKGGT